MSEFNIYQKLLKITEELGVVAKNLSVGTGNSSYKAVGEADILSAVKPLEIEYGVYSYPLEREIVAQEIIKGEKKGYKKDDPPIQTLKFFMRLKTTYRFVNIEKPSEYVDQVSYGDGVDSLDKSSGKAMTYSDKYSLMKAYKIMTGEDPDQNHSNETRPSRKKETPKKDEAELYKEIIALKMSVEDTIKWEEYYKVNSLFDCDAEQMQFILTRFENRLSDK